MTFSVKSVSIDQAEGMESRMVRGTFPTIAEANAALTRIQAQCEPNMLGYLKTDVVITWENGETHDFRADVNQHGDDTNLSEMLRSFAERYKPGTTDERNLKHLLSRESLAQWEKRATDILTGVLES